MWQANIWLFTLHWRPFLGEHGPFPGWWPPAPTLTARAWRGLSEEGRPHRGFGHKSPAGAGAGERLPSIARIPARQHSPWGKGGERPPRGPEREHPLARHVGACILESAHTGFVFSPPASPAVVPRSSWVSMSATPCYPTHIQEQSIALFCMFLKGVKRVRLTFPFETFKFCSKARFWSLWIRT